MIRTCIGCRERAEKSTLVRVVARSAPSRGAFLIEADPDATLPGRGAYLHPSSGCLELAIRRRAFGRALRVEGTPHTEALRGMIAEFENRSTDHEGSAPPDRKRSTRS